MSDYEEEDEAASPEEKLAICRYFIMDCPPGHVSAVVAGKYYLYYWPFRSLFNVFIYVFM